MDRDPEEEGRPTLKIAEATRRRGTGYRLRELAAAALAALVMIGCATPIPALKSDAPPLVRIARFGGGLVLWPTEYELIVHEDGIVVWNGKKAVAELGRRTKRIGPDTVEQIRRSLLSLKNVQDERGLRCSDADIGHLETGGRLFVFSDCGRECSFGCASPLLLTIRTSVERLVGTDEWLGERATSLLHGPR
jgi:hypothetical protein